MKIEKVTCSKISVGDTIISEPYFHLLDGAGEIVRRDRTPMKIAEIRESRRRANDRVITHHYYDAEGTWISYAGGRTMVEKVIG